MRMTRTGSDGQLKTSACVVGSRSRGRLATPPGKALGVTHAQEDGAPQGDRPRLSDERFSGNTSYVWAMVALAVLALAAAIRLPGTATEQG
jgi:hypothetical protein